MFNEKRIEEIRKRVQVSTLLSDHEKSDWLNLLDLMNDKQLGELEEILNMGEEVNVQPIPAPQPPVAQPPVNPQPAAPAAPVKMPPLSHLANVPTNVNMSHSVPQTAVRPTAMPNAPTKPSASKPTSQPAPATAKPSMPTMKPLEPAKPSSTFKPQPVEPPPTHLEKYDIDHIAELEELSPTTLRHYELQSVVDVIRQAIQNYGYFQVLQLIESSPLHKGYIKTGKAMMGHKESETANPELNLTQTELEFMADLLRHMRFNNWE
jgi:hypothetical protein